MIDFRSCPDLETRAVSLARLQLKTRHAHRAFDPGHVLLGEDFKRMAPNAGSFRIQWHNNSREELVGYRRPFRSGKIFLKNRLRRMLTQAENTAATLKCTHVPVFGFSINRPNQSRVVGIIPWMNRRRRAERDEIISIRVRLSPRVQNVHVERKKKIV